jgi:hypothetical protein
MNYFLATASKTRWIVLRLHQISQELKRCARHPRPAVAVFGNGQTRNVTNALRALWRRAIYYR